MPRPNHDISNLLLGAVKDYAEEQDLSPEEAHSELLRSALEAEGIICSGDGGDDRDP